MGVLNTHRLRHREVTQTFEPVSQHRSPVRSSP
jgi:hypothetical protein